MSPPSPPSPTPGDVLGALARRRISRWQEESQDGEGAERGASGAGPREDPRRRQLARPRISRRGRLPRLLRAGRGSLARRRGRQPLRGLRGLVGATPLRPCLGSRRGSGPARRRTRHQLRCAARGRGPPRGEDLGPRSLGGDGPAGLLGDRGHTGGDPPRPRRHGPRSHPQIRGLLPRSLGLAAGEGRLRRGDAGPSRLSGRAGAAGRVHPHPPLQRHRTAGSLLRPARRYPRLCPSSSR